MTFGAMEILSSDQLRRLLLAASDTAQTKMAELVSQLASLSIEDQREIRSWMTSSLTAAPEPSGEHGPVETWALENSLEFQIALTNGVLLWSATSNASELRECKVRSLTECARRASDAHKCVLNCRSELITRDAVTKTVRPRRIA
jgi:hypothetical protein